MRIALFFIAFTLGAGVAAGMAAADATSHHQRPGSQTVTVDVPATPDNVSGAVEVQPVRWQGELATGQHASSTTSSWAPGAGDLALAVVAAGTLGAGLVWRRRALVPVRA
jgi:hypothetical protein